VTGFQPRLDHELDGLTDEDLIAYVRAARDAGDRIAAQRGLAILVYGHWENTRRRVALKVPAHHVEDITGDVITAALEAAFNGTSVGELVNWLKTITARKIADHYRRGRGAEPVAAALGGATDDDHPALDPGEPDETGYVAVQDAIERVLERRSVEHRSVVERVVFEGYSARDAGRPHGIRENNAHQIVSRFRSDLRDELDDDTSGSLDD